MFVAIDAIKFDTMPEIVIQIREAWILNYRCWRRNLLEEAKEWGLYKFIFLSTPYIKAMICRSNKWWTPNKKMKISEVVGSHPQNNKI